jgi:hypothetical protein
MLTQNNELPLNFALILTRKEEMDVQMCKLSEREWHVERIQKTESFRSNKAFYFFTHCASEWLFFWTKSKKVSQRLSNNTAHSAHSSFNSHRLLWTHRVFESFTDVHFCVRKKNLEEKFWKFFKKGNFTKVKNL